MEWFLLLLAGLFEIVGSLGIKRTARHDNFVNNMILIGGFVISLTLLTFAMKTISLSTAYAIWTAIGTVGTAAVGILFYRESRDPFRLACIAGVLVCVLMLRIVE